MGRIDHIVTEIYCDGPDCKAQFSGVAGKAFHVEDRVNREGWHALAGSWLCRDCWAARWTTAQE